MTADDTADASLPPELPPLDLTLTPASPADWLRIVSRARLRRRRVVAATTVAVVVAAGLPAVALLPRPQGPPPTAHSVAQGYNGVCDVPYDTPAPAGDRIAQSFRTADLLISPPGSHIPAVDGVTLRQRAERRNQLKPGSQVRYGVVRWVNRGGRGLAPQLRWVVTTCGIPNKVPIDLFLPGPPPTAPPPRPTAPPKTVTVLTDVVDLLSDSGAVTASMQEQSFNGVCDTRASDAAPARALLQEFHVGEIKVVPPPKGASLGGRTQALAAARRRFGSFPGTQVRLGLVEPLHEAGRPRLRWIVTTCGLDGNSVRPRLPGAVNEALVYDASGTLLAEHRSGARSDGERYEQTAPPMPTPVPTYVPTGPNICGMWSHAYPDFQKRAAEAGYSDMQGCSRTQGSVIIFVSSPEHGAAAAVVTSDGKTYQGQYDARFPYSVFNLLPAPDGATRARLLRYLTPRVAEVELSGPTLPAQSFKFDALALRWLPCGDTEATRQPCQGSPSGGG